MNDRFLSACRREPTDATPVWLMRQAGRYMPEYRALREKHTLIEICKTPELALQVTLQPLRLGVDAAILFSDILLLLEPMGAPFSFAKGEGPVIHEPVRDARAINGLRVIDPEEDLAPVLAAIKLIRRELADRVPLIGFSGAPFTLASYLIEGGHPGKFITTKRLMYAEPGPWADLMGKLAEVVRRYLRAQVAAGAQAVMLFDSWAGALSPDDYRQYALPFTAHALRDVEKLGVPVIHFGTDTAGLLPLIKEAGGTVIGADFRIALDDAWSRLGSDVAIQGNLDPAVLLGPWDVVERAAASGIAKAAGRAGHVFNLGHGVLPETPVENVQRLVEYVHRATERTVPG
jgi:uroporphyrinogen decarboxylase